VFLRESTEISGEIEITPYYKEGMIGFGQPYK
jgi:hypothetical protein